MISNEVFFLAWAGVSALIAAVFSVTFEQRRTDPVADVEIVDDEANEVEVDLPHLGTFSFDDSEQLVVHIDDQGVRLLGAASTTLFQLSAGVGQSEGNFSLVPTAVTKAHTALHDDTVEADDVDHSSTRSAYFRKAGIQVLFHITRSANWESIVTSDGLLAKRHLSEKGINPDYFTDSLSHSLDVRKNLDNHVHLAFVYNSPMFYRFVQRLGDGEHPPNMLVLSVDALDLPGALFTNVNAAKNSAEPSPRPDVITSTDLERIKASLAGKFMDSRIEAIRSSLQSEALIPKRVPMRYIIGKLTYKRKS